MSIRYRNASGQEIIASGLTPGGDIEAGAVAEVHGSVTIPQTAAGGSDTIQVTFPDSFEMPSNDYLVDLNNTSSSAYVLYVSDKTKTGFTLNYRNITSGSAIANTVNYICTKTYTVQHAAQNAESIATIEAAMPAGAGSANKLALKSYVDSANNALSNRIADFEDLIPTDASITNKLVTESEMEAIENASSVSYDNTNSTLEANNVQEAIDELDTEKQNKLTFDNVPTTNSNNPVKSGGIKSEFNTRDEQISNLRNNVDNIINENYQKNLIPNTRTSLYNLQGLDFVVYDNGRIHVSGTATGETGFTWSNYHIDSGTYTVTSGYSDGKSSDGKGNVFINGVYSDGTVNVVSIGSSSNPSKTTFTIDDTVYPKIQVGIYIANGTTIDGDFYPMLRDASIEDDSYQPYKMNNLQLTNQVAKMGGFRCIELPTDITPAGTELTIQQLKGWIDTQGFANNTKLMLHSARSNERTLIGTYTQPNAWGFIVFSYVGLPEFWQYLGGYNVRTFTLT